MGTRAPLLVLGVGNVLLKDDGIGVYLAQELAKRRWPTSVEVVDGGTLGLGLLPLVEGRRALVLLDAMRSPERLGTLYWLVWPKDVKGNLLRGLFGHEGGSLPLILAAELTGCLPAEVWLGAIGVAVVETGYGLSEGVAARWPGLLGEVTTFVEKIAGKLAVGGEETVADTGLA